MKTYIVRAEWNVMSTDAMDIPIAANSPEEAAKLVHKAISDDTIDLANYDVYALNHMDSSLSDECANWLVEEL